jgi:hypothetical protein
MISQNPAHEVAKIAGAIRAQSFHRVDIERAVALKLRFAEELIRRALMRKVLFVLKYS